MTLIKFENFSFRYKENKEYALNNINLKINKNRFILLAGETGSGKTSLIRCMNGLIPRFYSGYYKGIVYVGEKNTIDTAIADLSTEVGIVFQNPENQLIAMDVEHELVFGMENIGLSPEIIKQRLEEVIQLTDIESLLSKAPYEISGGEQQRVAIASILVLEPKLIILDEPTANLDPYISRKIIALLKEIQRERNITVMISEHRLDLVLPAVDEIILMKEGNILMHDSKELVISNEIFQTLNLNKPQIYSVFNQLKIQNIITGEAPLSIPEALNRIRSLK